jgi:hypothetical protein
MSKTKKNEAKAAIAELWRQGILRWKLKGVQNSLYDIFHGSAKGSQNIFLTARQCGKTYSSLLIALETCLQNPGCIVKYLCPQLDQAQTLIRPQMRELLADCPPDVIPSEEDIWKEQQKRYILPNNSQIQIGGTDKNNVQKLRGGTATLAICDEAGFMDNFKRNIRSVILPTLRIKKGKLLILSTASEDPNHEFMVDFVAPAEADGTLIKYTIYENPLFSPQDIEDTIKQYPRGIDDPDFKREYLCISEIDQEKNVLNNFTQDLQNKIVREVECPKMRDYYIGVDVGFKDLTAALFGYYDFLNARVVILDELIMNGEKLTSKSFAEEVRKKEAEYFVDWNDNNVKFPPYRRVMDNNLIFINDLHKLHGLLFMPTKKDKKEAHINQVKTMLEGEQIIIHPRCKHLLYHMKAAKWDKNRKDFLRLNDSLSGQVKGGHADTIPALVYMIRNIDKTRNPYPKDFFKQSGHNWFQTLQPKLTEESKTLKELSDSLMNRRWKK